MWAVGCSLMAVTMMFGVASTDKWWLRTFFGFCAFVWIFNAVML